MRRKKWLEQIAKISGKVSIPPFQKHLIFKIWAENKECLHFSSGHGAEWCEVLVLESVVKQVYSLSPRV